MVKFDLTGNNEWIKKNLNVNGNLRKHWALNLILAKKKRYDYYYYYYYHFNYIKNNIKLLFPWNRKSESHVSCSLTNTITYCYNNLLTVLNHTWSNYSFLVLLINSWNFLENKFGKKSLLGGPVSSCL